MQSRSLAHDFLHWSAPRSTGVSGARWHILSCAFQDVLRGKPLSEHLELAYCAGKTRARKLWSLLGVLRAIRVAFATRARDLRNSAHSAWRFVRRDQGGSPKLDALPVCFAVGNPAYKNVGRSVFSKTTFGTSGIQPLCALLACVFLSKIPPASARETVASQEDEVKR